MQNTAIALIFDDPNVRQTMRGVLNHRNYAIVEYDSAMAAKPDALDNAFTVCLGVDNDADIALLGRVHSADPELPVVVIGRAELGRRALEAGAYDFVAQPVEPGNLRRVIAHAVEKRELVNKVHELRSELTTRDPDSGDEDDAGSGQVVVPLRELERRAIEGALRATKGSVTKAAKLLGIGRATLYRRLASPEMAGLRSRRGYEPHSSPLSALSVADNSH
jgi:two-component system NtrC family response regulator